VLLIGIPAALYFGFRPARAAAWMGLGLGLATLANLVRVVTLLVLSQRIGPQIALGTVHPILGMLLMLVVFGLLFGLSRCAPLPRVSWSPAAPRNAFFALGMAALLAMGAQWRLLQFGELPAGSQPGPDVATVLDVVPRVPGWQSTVDHQIDWQDLFGAQSQSYVLDYTGQDGLLVTGQIVTTPDANSLLTYTPERCGVYHGEQVRGQKTVDLGFGQTGYLVDSVDQVPVDRNHPLNGQLRPLAFDVLYWYVPFSVDGQPWYARFTLILDSDAAQQISTAGAAPAVAPGGPDFDRVDGALVTLAQAMTAGTAGR